MGARSRLAKVQAERIAVMKRIAKVHKKARKAARAKARFRKYKRRSRRALAAEPAITHIFG